MNTQSYRTRSVSSGEVDRKWHVIDATDLVVGRFTSKVASILRGKHTPNYSPNADTGDYVIIVNAEKVRFKGNNKWNQKVYLTHSLYPGGQKSTNAAMMLEKHPVRILERAIKGMLPKNTLGRQMYRKLFIYEGAEHPHAAQQPVPLVFDDPSFKMVEEQ